MNYLLILIFSALIINPCNKDNSNSGRPEKESASGSDSVKSEAVINNDGSVYLGRFSKGTLIIEDNATYMKNELSWAKDTFDNYDKYIDYLRAAAKKYASYKEENTEYYFDNYADEFKKLTTLKKGERIFISSYRGVTQGEITKYYMNFDDLVGSGVVFYAAADPGKADFTEDEIVICTKNSNMSKFITSKLTGTNNEELIKNVKSHFLTIAKDIKVKDESSEKEKYIPVTGIDTSEIVIFSGSFTAAGANEFIAGYTKRQSFDNFAYYIIVVNENGEPVKVFSKLVKDSFTYETLAGIVDINGDGIYEILTEDGYYEGAGYNLHRLEGGEFKVIAGGFFFGV